MEIHSDFVHDVSVNFTSAGVCIAPKKLLTSFLVVGSISKKDWNRKCMDGTHYLDIIFSNGVKNSPKCHRLDRNLYSNNPQSDSISLHTNVSHLYTFQIPSPVCYEPHFPKKESAFINSQNDFDFSRRDFIS